MQKRKVMDKRLIRISIQYRGAFYYWKSYTKEFEYSESRLRRNVIVRHAFSVACRELTNLSLNEIGGIINKDHATVIHAGRQHESNMLYLPTYKEVYEEIRRGLSAEINYQEDVKESNSTSSVKELRTRLIDVSQRLRHKIVEYEELKNSVLKKPNRIEEENVFLKKHAKALHERNKRLEKELKRVKNLI